MAISTWHHDLDYEDNEYTVEARQIAGHEVFFRTNPYYKQYCQVWVEEGVSIQNPEALGLAIRREMNEMGFYPGTAPFYQNATPIGSNNNIVKTVNAFIIA